MRTKSRCIRFATFLGLMTMGVWPVGAASPPSSEPIQLAQAGKTYQLRMASSLSAKDPYIVRQVRMIQRIKERTNGTVVITQYPGDALMKGPDVPKSIARGTIDMDSVSMNNYNGISDISTILTPGFVGLSSTDTLKVLVAGSEGRKILDEHFADIGVKALAFWDQADIGFVSYSPLNRIEAFKGKKLRVANDLAAAVLRALGAEPTVMGGAEAVDAMRRKIIEGSTCPPTCIISRGYMDFAKYYTHWTVLPNLGMLAVNRALWNGLPEDVRKVVQEEADAAAKDQTELVATTQGQAMWKLGTEKGMSLAGIDPAEAAKLRAIAKPVFDDFVKDAKPQPQASRMADLLMQAADKK